MRSWLALVPALFLLPAAACQQLPSTEDDDDGPSAPASTGGGTLLPGNDDTGDEMADGDSGGESVCNPVTQIGCPPSEKCTAILSGGEIVYACAADSGGLDPNSSCQPSPADGIDGCPTGYACLRDEGGNSLCAALCLADADCTQAQCIPSRELPIPYCADDCSPFEASCPSPLSCRRNGNRFSCQFIGEGDVGPAGSPCAIADDAGCAPGLVCLPGALVPDCVTDNCCTPVCDVTEAMPCSSPAICSELLPGAAPGFEEIGACFVPA